MTYPHLMAHGPLPHASTRRARGLLHSLAAAYTSDEVACIGAGAAVLTLLTAAFLQLLGALGALPTDPATLATLYGGTT